MPCPAEALTACAALATPRRDDADPVAAGAEAAVAEDCDEKPTATVAAACPPLRSEVAALAPVRSAAVPLAALRAASAAAGPVTDAAEDAEALRPDTLDDWPRRAAAPPEVAGGLLPPPRASSRDMAYLGSGPDQTW